jgi:hypothetical protein
MADFQTFEVDVKPEPSTQDHDILYSNRSSEGEQLLIRPLLHKTKNNEYGRQLTFKINILF